MEKWILIFRHGETDWNREGRFQGHIDVPMNETGRLQARQLIPDLRQYDVQAILSSDLTRAYETARIAANELSLPVFIDSGLREAHLGAAEGLVKEEIEQRFGSEIALRWKSNHLTDADVSYPGGESGAAIIQRVFMAIERFIKVKSYTRIGIATHGGVIRRVMSRILPPGSEMVPIPNGVHYLLKYEVGSGRWMVESSRGGPRA